MNILKIIGSVFACVGLVFILVSFWTYRNTQQFLAQSETAQGEVIDLVLRSSHDGDSGTSSGVYYPVVRFATAEGEYIEFQSGVGSQPPAYRIGDSVTVRYRPDNPYRARIDSFFQLWFLSVLFGGLGFVFGSIGLVLILVVYRTSRKNKWLLANGQIIYADLERVILDRSIRMRGRNPYRILCQWLEPRTQTVCVFRSKPIWYNPEDYLHQDKIPVRIDPANPRRYVVDLSFLPKSMDSVAL